MREIKFRTWDKVDNKMYKVLRLPLSFIAGGLLLHTPIDGEEMIEDKNTDNYELMQFTGLKDKNGKDIYEGDIVQWDQLKYWSDDGGEYIKLDPPVVIKSDLVVIEWKDSIRNCGCCNDVYGVGFDFSDMPLQEIEVIGNIYENPELLKNL